MFFKFYMLSTKINVPPPLLDFTPCLHFVLYALLCSKMLFSLWRIRVVLLLAYICQLQQNIIGAEGVNAVKYLF